MPVEDSAAGGGGWTHHSAVNFDPIEGFKISSKQAPLAFPGLQIPSIENREKAYMILFSSRI
jgi:hypothetical protein